MRTEKDGIYAPKDGIVIASLAAGNSPYGNRIYIEYPDEYKTIQAHNRKNLVKEGDEVKKGELIAIMGDTGVGPKHSHLGLVPPGKPLSDLKINCVNPIPWLIDGACYPTNKMISAFFQEWFDTYFHEGLDFRGNEDYLIPEWRNGLDNFVEHFYKYKYV